MMNRNSSQRPLLVMTAGDMIQLVGGHVFSIAIATHTYSMTGAAWAYALQMLLSYLPWMLFSGIAGPIVDRLDRRQVMIVAAVSRGVLGFLYPYFTTIEPVLALNFISSTCSVFLVTARTAVIPTLAEKDALLKVNGLRAAATGCIDLTAPTLAGIVMGSIGTGVAFRLIGVLWFGGAVAYWLMGPVTSPRDRGQRPDAPAKRTLVSDLRGAAAFLRDQPALVVSVAAYTIYVMGQHGTNTLFYPFVESVLGRGSELFGLSISFYFGANLLAGLVLAKYGRALTRIPVLFMTVPATLIWFGYSVVRSIPVILAMGFVEGFIMSLVTTLFTTEVQSRAPVDMTGRVWGVAYGIGSGGEVIGILLAGSIAGASGPLAGYRVLSGLILTLAAAAYLGGRIALRRRESV